MVPYSSLAFTSAPASRSTVKTSGFSLEKAAQISGVVPYSFLALTSLTTRQRETVITVASCQNDSATSQSDGFQPSQLVSCAANGVKANDKTVARASLMRVIPVASKLVWVEKVSL